MQGCHVCLKHSSSRKLRRLGFVLVLFLPTAKFDTDLAVETSGLLRKAFDFVESLGAVVKSLLVASQLSQCAFLDTFSEGILMHREISLPGSLNTRDTKVLTIRLANTLSAGFLVEAGEHLQPTTTQA